MLFFSLFLFGFQINAQQNSQQNSEIKFLDLASPLKLNFEFPIEKTTSIINASDNVLKLNEKLNNQNLIITFENGKIEKINLEKNAVLWVSDLGGEIISDPTFENGKVYLVTKVLGVSSVIGVLDSKNQIENNILWSIDTETGLTEWQLPFTSDEIMSLNISQDKIILTTKNGVIYLIEKNETRNFRRVNLSLKIYSAPSFTENKIYLGTADNSILVVSAENGEILSELPKLQSAASVLGASGNQVFWGDKKGSVNLFDTTKKKKIWSVHYGGEISSLDLVRDGILVSSLDNFVYLISIKKGKTVWKRRLAGRVSTKPLVSGNFAVFTVSGNDNAVILDLRDGKIVNQIALDGKGAVLSTPLITGNSLLFLTNKGIFSFVGTESYRSQN